jgi:hypothetical protein
VALLPVICDDCGRVFVTTSLIGGSATNIVMVGNVVSPCPYCRGTGRIPDGVYDLSDAVTRYLAAPSVSVEDLEKLRALLERAAEEGSAADAVADEIEKEIPALAEFGAWVRRAAPVVAKALWPFLVGLLLLLIQQRMERPTLTPDQVEHIIERVQHGQPSAPFR